MAKLTALVMSAAVLVTALPAASQSSAEVNAAGLQFNLMNPGARSLGLGGAFTGLADDATAAYANPAGLMNLSRPELSFEGRHWKYANFYTNSGHILGQPSHLGLDTLSGVHEGDSRDQLSGLSFASFVYPRPRWAVAVYRHELGNFKSSAQTEGAFLGLPGGTTRMYPTRSVLDLRMESYGAGLAFRIGEHWLAGLTTARYSFSLDSFTNRYWYSLSGDLTGPGAIFGPAVEDPRNVLDTQIQHGRDSSWAFNGGILWQPSPRVSVGAVYKEGSNYGVAVSSLCGPARANGPCLQFAPVPGRFHVPTAFGTGFMFKPTDLTMFVMDLVRVQYSSLTRDLVPVFGEPNDHQYRVADGTEAHAGFEYVIVRSAYSIPLRIGTWRDPDHRIHYVDESNSDPSVHATEIGQSLLFRSGPADQHYSIGFGIAARLYRIEVAYDRSHRQKIGSASMVTRF